jgi:glycosyltransferase involved in cell wall biosynthesis
MTTASSKTSPIKVAFIAPGLHRVVRGAEVAFESVARELAQLEGVQVTLFGSGKLREDEPYQFQHVPNIPRESFEHWPKFPVLRSEYAYEELTFTAALTRHYQPSHFDVVVSYSYPFVNWLLGSRGHRQNRPVHIYVTQNGDWEVHTNRSELRYFSCDGLICTNPEYYERNKNNWTSTLIPNGVDPKLFTPGGSNRANFNLPEGVPLALMVSALIPSKRVCEGINAASKIAGLHLVVCGDGPERDKVKALGTQLMPERFYLLRLPRQNMPEIYRAADVFLHMSLDEPSANAYIEALATGLPIVTHNRFVTQWTLEDTSVLVDATSESEVANGISQALKLRSKQHVNLRRELVGKRFTWEKIGLMYHSFFEEII